MKFELSFTNKAITPWDGAYGVDVILESFITGIWCEAKRFLHTEVTRADTGLLGKYSVGREHRLKMRISP